MQTTKSEKEREDDRGWRAYLSEEEVSEVVELESISAELLSKRIAVTSRLALIRNRCNTRKNNRKKREVSGE